MDVCLIREILQEFEWRDRGIPGKTHNSSSIGQVINWNISNLTQESKPTDCDFQFKIFLAA